jgi:ribosomal protein S18 acetylase RimI-like enzyme
MLLALRPCTEHDEGFIHQLFECSAGDGLPAELIPSQSRLQLLQYQQLFPNTCFNLVLLAGNRIGRLYVAHAPDAIVIVEITILPRYRRQGIGSSLIRTLLDDAARLRVPVQLKVRKDSPARTLYRRLGFKETSEGDLFISMTASG